MSREKKAFYSTIKYIFCVVIKRFIHYEFFYGIGYLDTFTFVMKLKKHFDEGLGKILP